MYIIFGKKIAEELKSRHVVLELETFTDPQGNPITAYCVIQQESIPLSEIHDVDRLCRLHAALIDSLHQKRYSTVLDCIEHLRGAFSGEVDSFYEIIATRINNMEPQNEPS